MPGQVYPVNARFKLARAAGAYWCKMLKISNSLCIHAFAFANKDN
jgi:hypothetical protein